jgi:hypothetical protein
MSYYSQNHDKPSIEERLEAIGSFIGLALVAGVVWFAAVGFAVFER